jgi:hypothetical protein
VNMIINLPVPSNVGNFLTSQGRVNFARRTLLHGVRCAGLPTVSKEEETHFRRTDSCLCFTLVPLHAFVYSIYY